MSAGAAFLVRCEMDRMYARMTEQDVVMGHCAFPDAHKVSALVLDLKMELAIKSQEDAS